MGCNLILRKTMDVEFTVAHTYHWTKSTKHGLLSRTALLLVHRQRQQHFPFMVRGKSSRKELIKLPMYESPIFTYKPTSYWPKSDILFHIELFLHNIFIVAMCSGNKLIQKDNADSGVRFIIPGGPRQSLLLAKDLTSFCENHIYPECTCPNPPPQILWN